MENAGKYSGIKNIAILVLPQVQLLDVAGPCDVFIAANFFLTDTQYGLKYQVHLISGTSDKIIYSGSGIPLICSYTIYDIDFPIDTLLVAGTDLSILDDVNPEIYGYLQNIMGEVRRLGSVCVGAFILAKAGLLTGKQVTTHWKYADILQRTYPDLNVNINPFFIYNQGIYTSGGVSSGIDLALALLEEDFGKPIASEVAKHLVLHLKRPGVQSQFGNAISDYGTLSPFTKEIRDLLKDKLGQVISIEFMAESVHMSVRNFSRVFLKESGMTPGKFLEKMRLDQAKNMLEYTEMSIDMIAEKCGFGTVASLRRLFLKYLFISPSQYRKTSKGTI
ncbi:L-rhamnose operon regulatory protein rhaS [Chryseobacterium nakagawai]|uniref:Helix-turn-helix domain-containing protein n=1 Tax=Chryseobacterium nakagawai TaxID=1241982 RepID=A0AAD1DT20_CHRNA|nr:helix-turn-helix domain-containing protein [Chryseobacterium nakagawai]AZA93513.1 helix-turn-helix domain-containing protein [Chryseobacterium nakagawai]VEH20202.1 L-rhamnose operon regulatory protein rhaS [Chryseobacterium nakagawai]